MIVKGEVTTLSFRRSDFSAAQEGHTSPPQSLPCRFAWLKPMLQEASQLLLPKPARETLQMFQIKADKVSHVWTTRSASYILTLHE